MKKKLLIGALGLASVFTMSSFQGDSSSEMAARRPMFGSQETGWGPCEPTGEIQADGTPVLMQEVQVTTYIFWVGFPHIETKVCN
jgi:hypothetical protein